MDGGSLTPSSVISECRAFLSEYIRDVSFSDHQNFFTSGLLNSLFAMQLVVFVERQFQVEIGDEDLDVKHFCSVQAISDFVGAKRAGSAAIITGSLASS